MFIYDKYPSHNCQICCPSNLKLHDNPDIWAFSKHYYLLMCLLHSECSGELIDNYIWTVDRDGWSQSNWRNSSTSGSWCQTHAHTLMDKHMHQQAQWGTDTTQQLTTCMATDKHTTTCNGNIQTHNCLHGNKHTSILYGTYKHIFSCRAKYKQTHNYL